jgi:hypothetical protein
MPRSFVPKSEFYLALEHHLDDKTGASDLALAHLAVARPNALAITGHIDATVGAVFLRAANVAVAAGGVTLDSLL